jgi:hypothetical protein
MGLLLAIMLGAVIVAGTTNTNFSSPDTLFENGEMERPLPKCEEVGFSGKQDDAKAKAATFSIRGEYHCGRDIYQYGERDSFYEYVTKSASQRLRQAVLTLNNKPELREQTWRVQVISDDEAVKAYLKTLATTELVESLGSGHVARLDAIDSKLPTLFVRVRRVEDTSLLLGVYAQFKGATWQL